LNARDDYQLLDAMPPQNLKSFHDTIGANGVGMRFLSELERGKETAELGLALRVAASLGLSLRVGNDEGRR